MSLETHLKQATILIIDDDLANVLLLTRMLRGAGYSKVFSTTDSTRVEQLYRELQPDLILLDVHMPRVDGLQLLQRLPAQEGAVPVLAITGDLDSDTKLQALMLGARDLLTKPIDYTDLMLRVRNLLEIRFLVREESPRPIGFAAARRLPPVWA